MASDVASMIQAMVAGGIVGLVAWAILVAIGRG